MRNLTPAITSKLVRAHIEQHLTYLTDPKGAVALGRGKEWRKQFSPNPGVYCIFEGTKLIYSGETGSVVGRLRDLMDTRNHTLRRQLGNTKFAKHADYQPASSRSKFPDVIETKLNSFMTDRLKVKALSVSLGRKEIEEAIIDSHSPKYNIKRRRGELFDIPGV